MIAIVHSCMYRIANQEDQSFPGFNELLEGALEFPKYKEMLLFFFEINGRIVLYQSSVRHQDTHNPHKVFTH